MADGEQTDKSDDTGKKPDPEPKKDEPISIVDEARGIRDEIVKARDSLKEEREKLEKAQANEMLGGTGGGHLETKQVSPEDKKIEQAKEYFKDTALGDDIKKVSEKK